MKPFPTLLRWWRNRPCYVEDWTPGGPILVECETYWRAIEAERNEREQVHERLCEAGMRARCV